jgi:hypothetical protein
MVTCFFNFSKIEKMVNLDDSFGILVPYEEIIQNKIQEKDISKIHLVEIYNKIREDESQQQK